MTDDWSDKADRQLARSIFGTEERASAERIIVEWLSRQGFRQPCIGAIELSVGAAVTVDVSDSSKIFVKVWAAQTEAAALRAQLAVQRFLARRATQRPLS